MNAVASMYDLASRNGLCGVALVDSTRGNRLIFPAAYSRALPVGLTGSPALQPLGHHQPPAAPPFLLPPAATVHNKRTGFSIEDILNPKDKGTKGGDIGRQNLEEDAFKYASDEEMARRVFSTRLLQTSAARAFFRLNDPLRHPFNSSPYHHHHHHAITSRSSGTTYGAPPSHTSLPPAALSVPIPVPVYLRGKSPGGSPHDAASAGARAAKKCRRSRTVFTELQLMGLEKRFERQKYLSTPDRLELADTLGLSQLQVKTWYQNRRMKWKKQVLQGGSHEAPTKPKGRPKKSDIQQSTTPLSQMTSPPASPASSCYSQSSSDAPHAYAQEEAYAHDGAYAQDGAHAQEEGHAQLDAHAQESAIAMMVNS